MTKSWETTSWSQMGLSVVQAFGTTLDDRQQSHIIDLSPEETNEMKAWIRIRVARWGKPISTIFQMLRLTSRIDPELVRRIRIQPGRRKESRLGQITPAMLKIVTDHFPGEEYYPTQRALMRVSTERYYSTKEMRALITKLSIRLTPDMSEEKIYRLALANSLDTKKATRARRAENTDDKKRGKEIRWLRKRVTALEIALEVANKNEGFNPELWWQKADFLSSQERTLMEEVMYRNNDLEEVARLLGLTPLRALACIRSAFRKRLLLEK